jgi:hypothetical protein
VITPGAGVVRVSIDNDGRLTSVHSSVRAIEQLSERPMTTTPIPAPVDMTMPSQSSNPLDYEQRLASEFSRRLVSWVVKGGMPLEFTTVPGSTKIGYDIRGNRAILIARKPLRSILVMAIANAIGSRYRYSYERSLILIGMIGFSLLVAC